MRRFLERLLNLLRVYGVTAYAVALKRREFAIRLVLGAPRARVVDGVQAGYVARGRGPERRRGGRVSRRPGTSGFLYGLPAAHAPTLLGTVTLFLTIGAVASVVPVAQAIREGWRRALHED